MNNSLKNIKTLLNTLALSFPLTITACGGGSNSEQTAEVVTPPEVVTTPVYGLFDMVLPSNKTRTIFLDKERSYIFSVAENDFPVTELMCLSEETLQDFSETLTSQTLNFTCSGSSIQPISLTISFDDKLSIKYIHDIEFDYELPLDDLVNIDTPNFRYKTRNYLNPVRNDIDISRYIYANPRYSSRTPESSYIEFNIFSRDWPIGGDCIISKKFRITDMSSITVNDTYEYASFPHSGVDWNPSNGIGCTGKVLPMPASYSDLDTRIYTLIDGSYFIVFEQQSFITMARFYESD